MSDLAAGIQHGTLITPAGIRIALSGLRITELSRSHGDVSASDLASHLIEVRGAYLIAASVLKHARNRHSLIVMPNTETAEMAAAELRRQEMNAVCLPSDADDPDRARILAALRTGEYNAVSICADISLDLDAPLLDCLVMARPTTSQALYEHSARQVLLPSPGKHGALIIDICGTEPEPATKDITCLVPGFPAGATLNPGESLLAGLDRIRNDRDRYTRLPDGSVTVRNAKQFIDSPYQWNFQGDNLFVLGHEKVIAVARAGRQAWSVYDVVPKMGRARLIKPATTLSEARRFAEDEYVQRKLAPCPFKGNASDNQRKKLHALKCPQERIDRVTTSAEASALITLYETREAIRALINPRHAPRSAQDRRRGVGVSP